MLTCFLFLHQLQGESCLSLSLDEHGELIAPLASYRFTELRQPTQACKYIAVLPSYHASLHRLELPWLGEKKARKALPYALEDKLTQDPSSLHFAFDSHYYVDNHYLIAVLDKDYLLELMAQLKKTKLNITTLCLDWFALEKDEIWVMEDYLLINDNQFKGALSQELATFYLSALQAEPVIHAFSNSSPFLQESYANIMINHAETSHVKLAKRLQERPLLNLWQGELNYGLPELKTKPWYQAAAILSLCWLLSLLVFNAMKLHLTQQKIKQVDTQIATIYRQFFPKAQQIISPKFRISQMLKAQLHTTDKAFWILLNNLAGVFEDKLLHIQQLHFENQTLVLSLAAPNFETLDELQSRLQKAGVFVKQTQAATHNEQVISTLELKL